MATTHEQQEIAQIRPPVMGEAEGTSSEGAGALGQASNDQENIEEEPEAETLGNPLPGLRMGQEELFSQEGTVIALPGASPVGSGPSLSRSGGSEDVVRDGTATPRPLAAGEHPAVAGLPPRFPSPPRVALTGPFGVHRGPATSSSLTGSPIPTRLNPLAPVYYPNMAAAMLARGAPPGTRDPMDIPFDPAAGYTPVHPAAVAGLMNSAAHHAAMVFKRLIAADSVIFANELDAHFTRILGREYQEAVVRVIAEGSDNGTVESSSTADSNA